MPRPVHIKRSTCRACRARDLALFLPLGDVALANSFLKSPAEFAGERRFPLDVVLCRSCGLVQLVDVIAGLLSAAAQPDHMQAERLREPRDFIADFSQPQNQRGLTFEIARHIRHAHRIPDMIFLGFEPARKIAREHQQPRDRGLRDRLGRRAG